jgi:hypothetical protein
MDSRNEIRSVRVSKNTLSSPVSEVSQINGTKGNFLQCRGTVADLGNQYSTGMQMGQRLSQDTHDGIQSFGAGVERQRRFMAVLPRQEILICAREIEAMSAVSDVCRPDATD